MKKYLFFAAAAVALMVGCSKKEMQPANGSIDDTTVEAVKLGISAPSLVVTRTKGAGPVDQWDGSQNLRVLGFVKNIQSLTDAMRFGYSGGEQVAITVYQDIEEAMGYLEGNIVCE